MPRLTRHSCLAFFTYPSPINNLYGALAGPWPMPPSLECGSVIEALAHLARLKAEVNLIIVANTVIFTKSF